MESIFTGLKTQVTFNWPGPIHVHPFGMNQLMEVRNGRLLSDSRQITEAFGSIRPGSYLLDPSDERDELEYLTSLTTSVLSEVP